MRVRDVMTPNVRTCRPHDSLNEPARAMWEHDCGIVPVVDESRRVLGVITDRDICMAAYTQGETLAAIKVSSVMAAKVATCQQDDDVLAAVRTMRAARVRRLPVVDAEGKLAGVLSSNDLTRHATKDRSKRAVSADDLTGMLAAICEPRAPRTETKPAAEAVRANRLLAAGSPEPEC